MGGRASKQKGNRAERALVNFLRDAGLTANRLPLSGAMRGKFGGCDVVVPFLGREGRIEVKHHANGFQRLYRWLTGVDFLVVRCDRSEPLVVMPLKLMVELINAAAEKQNNP